MEESKSVKVECAKTASNQVYYTLIDLPDIEMRDNGNVRRPMKSVPHKYSKH